MKDKNKQNFLVQQWHANKRGIQWNLTYDEWLDIWIQSGHFHERGKGKDKYCMCRHGDIGPYEIGNVYITTYSQNNIDQHKFKPTFIGIHNSKETKTPLGVFKSRSAAAAAHNIPVWKLGRMIGKIKGYEYV
jgi:hypothetical protein